MPRRRGNKIKVWVGISGSRKYGFQTQETLVNKYKTNLGMTEFAGAAGVFFGANNPKPPRASFSDDTGTASSFCSENKVADLKKTEGWSITRIGSIRGVKTSGKTRTVYVEMPGGWNYAWNITAAEVDLAAILGFELATGADATGLVWGVGDPKPPRASKKGADGVMSTFMKPQGSAIERAANDGWTISSVPYDLIPNA